MLTNNSNFYRPLGAGIFVAADFVITGAGFYGLVKLGKYLPVPLTWLLLAGELAVGLCTAYYGAKKILKGECPPCMKTSAAKADEEIALISVEQIKPNSNKQPNDEDFEELELTTEKIRYGKKCW